MCMCVEHFKRCKTCSWICFMEVVMIFCTKPTLGHHFCSFSLQGIRFMQLLIVSHSMYSTKFWLTVFNSRGVRLIISIWSNEAIVWWGKHSDELCLPALACTWWRWCSNNVDEGCLFDQAIISYIFLLTVGKSWIHAIYWHLNTLDAPWCCVWVWV